MALLKSSLTSIDRRIMHAFNTSPAVSPEALRSQALAIFASRERMDVVAQALASVPEELQVDLIVNGNLKLADEAAQWLMVHKTCSPHRRIRLWFIPVADKGNAWNQYVHHIWEGESLVYFIDGYVRLQPDAIQCMNQVMAEHPAALGGTGIPSVGRATPQLKAQMLQYGGFHGNFCCIRGAALAELKARRIFIPVGMYRVDSLMGGMLMFGLRPSLAIWDPSRIAVAHDASWWVDEKHWWRWRDVKAKLKQLVRQAQGRAENLAVKHLFESQKADPEHLPTTVQQLISDWLRGDESNARRFLARSPLSRFAVASCLGRAAPAERNCLLSRLT